jgi:hypothetical protein
MSRRDGLAGRRPRLLRPSTAAVLGALALVLALEGCTLGEDATGDSAASEGWAAFGPFEKPAGHASADDLPGPSEIRLPDGSTARLDAGELLGTGLKLPARDDYEIIAESYLYTLDGDDPVVVGLVQTTRRMHYRGYTEDEFVTFVLGISTEQEPRELTRTRIMRGPEHTASFAGRSDQGVVAVLIEGTLNSDAPDDSRVIGVDAVRGTEVWVKEHGFPGFGEHTALFFVAPTRDSCASAVLSYTVANGIVISEEDFDDTDPNGDGACRTAAEAAG